MPNKLKRQKLIFVSILLLLSFTYPVISIPNRPQLIAGVPVLFLYILVTWVIAIIILYWLSDRKQKKVNG